MLIIDRLTNAMATFVATPAEARNLATTVWMAAGNAGLTICNLKPLAELLGCEPEIGAIKERVQVMLSSKASYDLSVHATIAQALNWERTEFDTLDELLEELRASEEAHSKFVDCAIEQNERMETVREKLREAEQFNDPLAVVDECVAMLELKPTSSFAEGGHVIDASAPTLYVQQFGRIKRPVTTHAVLHGTEYYPDSTILLQTAQLVAWRDADGQEHCERAHRVTLNPDRDGLAAAILSGIAGAQIAPEHIAELRAQMGGDIHG